MTGIITINDVRTFINDRAQTNTLIDGVNWSDKDIESAFISVIDYYNLLPPPLRMYTVETFPFRSVALLGIAGWLLKGAAIGHAANALSYSAAGVSVDDRGGKAALFGQLGNQMWDEFKALAQQMKVVQNVGGCYDHHGSEFLLRT